MDKWLLPILLICCIMAGCQKTSSDLDKIKAQAIVDDKIITDYIAAHGLTDSVKKVSDTSGVYYIVRNAGLGNDLFTSSTQVTVGYTGKLLTTQKIFAQTNDFHPSYVLGQVILGWQQGIPEIKKGGEVRLLLPSRYAYGPYPQPQLDSLPANAVLDFDIHLYDITN